MYAPKLNQTANKKSLIAQKKDTSSSSNLLLQQFSRMGNAPNPREHADMLNRAPANQQAANQQLLLQLQRQYGNGYVNQVVQLARHKGGQTVTASTKKPVVQAKLTVNPAGDKYEQEADRVADNVVQKMNEPTASSGSKQIQRQEMTPGIEEEDKIAQTKPEISSLQRQEMTPETEEEDKTAQTKPEQQETTPETEEEEENVAQTKSEINSIQGQKKTSDQNTADLETSIKQERGKGQPIDNKIREKLEQGFGADFSGVRIHTDAKSDRLNKSIQARAFTIGQDIFFRQGAYNPNSKQGQQLLAHELTHTIQQMNGLKLNNKQKTSTPKSNEKEKEPTLQAKEINAQTPDISKNKELKSPSEDNEPILLQASWLNPIDIITDIPLNPADGIANTLIPGYRDFKREMVEGAILGDFKEDPSIGNMIGQTLVGSIPYLGTIADTRDLTKQIIDLAEGGYEDPWEWIDVAFALVAFVPGAGDTAKAGWRALKKSLKNKGGKPKKGSNNDGSNKKQDDNDDSNRRQNDNDGSNKKQNDNDDSNRRQKDNDDSNKKQKDKDDSNKKQNEARHKILAQKAVKELENTDGQAKDDNTSGQAQNDRIIGQIQDYETIRQEKEQQARDIETSYTRELHKNKDDRNKKVKLTVHFEKDRAKDEKDGDLDFKVKIAPNTVTAIGSITSRSITSSRVALIPEQQRSQIPPQYIQDPQYTSLQVNWVNPVYGGTHTEDRGNYMNVILGPIYEANSLLTGGTSTNYGSISYIKNFLEYTTNQPWVAGHLLNADLGGSGTDPKNLVPLTSSANANHKTLEGQVKSACQNNYREWDYRVRQGITPPRNVQNPQQHVQNYLQQGDYFDSQG